MPHHRITDVPENRVANIRRGFEVQGCQNIQAAEQPNKMWTVEADCPDPPAINEDDG